MNAALVTGAPGAPSPNMAAAAAGAPAGGKANDDYSNWGSYSYNQVASDNNAAAAAAFNHNRGYGTGGGQAQATGHPGE